MKARVEIFYKDSVFDPQGNTVAQTLRRNGFPKVKDVRVGKMMELDLDITNKEEGKQEVRKMCEKLLANPVIESYRLQIIEE